MKAQILISPKYAFWGICIIASSWLAATALFEVYLGVPGNGIQWAKRLVGWGVEIWLLRTLLTGFNRRRATNLK